MIVDNISLIGVLEFEISLLFFFSYPATIDAIANHSAECRIAMLS